MLRHLIGTIVSLALALPSVTHGFDITTHGLSDALDVKGGASHTVVLKKDHTVIAWGGGDGQSNVPPGLSGVTAIGAGTYQTLAVKGDGTVAAWGVFADGQFQGPVAATVPANLAGVVAVAAGYSHAVALKSDGTVVAWGDNSYGQTTVPTGLDHVIAIAAGHYHTLALKGDGTVVAWGRNFEGQCSVPAGLLGVIAIDAKAYHTVALKSDGTVVCWGDDELGQGDVPAGLAGVKAIAAGGHHSVALKDDGTVIGWGDDEYGQSSTPEGLTGITAIAAGTYHTLATKGDQAIVGWGHNQSGQADMPTSIFLPVGNGSVTCNPSSVLPNSSSVCTVIPNAGYLLTSFLVNGIDQSAGVVNNSITLANITGNKSITAVFGSTGSATVNITAPAAGAAFTAPATIPITATAAASAGGAVSRVDFYAGSTLIGTSTSAPWSVSWSGVAAGSYSLTAKVTDSLNVTATSIPVQIRVANLTLSTAIAEPANGAAFSAPASISITATATAATGSTVKQVDFYAGSTLIGTATAAPWSATWSNVAAGSYSLTAKVTDNLGATVTSSPVSVSVFGGVLPASWSTQDIGSVAIPGTASYLDGAFAITGSGLDIWGTADGFRYVYQQVNGDCQIVARVASLQNTNIYAKGGVMIRESLSEDARQVTMDVTPGNGAEFLRRVTTAGVTAASNAINVSAPSWVKLVRSGTTFTGYVSNDGVQWQQVGQSDVPMAANAYVGLAVASHNMTLCASTIDGVTVTGAPVTPPSVSITEPTGGASFYAPATIPVHATATAGTGASVARVDFYAGAMLVGTAFSSPFTITWSGVTAGDYLLSAKVTDSLGATAASSDIVVTVVAKTPPYVSLTAPANLTSYTAPATIPIAASASAGTGAQVSRVDFFAGTTLVGSANAAPYSYNWTFVGAGQYLLTAKVVDSNGDSATSSDVSVTVLPKTPVSVSLTSPATGASFSAPATIPLAATASAGSGATVQKVQFYAGSTLVGTATTAPFGTSWSNVPAGTYSLTAKATDSLGGTATSAPVAISVVAATPATVALTAPAAGATFTAPATIVMSATASAGTGATVQKVDFYAGATLVGTASAAPYSITWRNVGAGAYSLTAKVTGTLGRTATSTPVGISVATAVPAAVKLTGPASGSAFYAPANITISASATAGTGATLPKVDFYSGTRLIGTATTAPYTITWANVAPGNYSLTAKVKDSLGGAATSNAIAVSVNSIILGQSLPLSEDIGTVPENGSASYLNGVYTVQGAGADISGSADAFRFVFKPMIGDGEIVARVLAVQNTSAKAKAGIMIRQTLNANSQHALMDITPGSGAELTRRTTSGGSTTVTTKSTITAPYWVKLVRSGNSFTGYISADGSRWEQVASSTIKMSGIVYVGLVVTSHSSENSTATFDKVK